MKKVNVNEASGPVLDWMVAKCEEANVGEGYYTGIVLRDGEVKYAPSTDWAQGGPVIEREGLDLWCALLGRPEHADPAWQKSHWRVKYQRMGYSTDISDGPTPLIAAMRCYVASKLGEGVEVPDELLCRCHTGPEWDGSPNPANPDNEWVCDDCGRVIKAEAP